MKPAPILLLLTVAILPAGVAVADDEHAYNVDNPTYRAECGSCHIAYPPRLLPARSWRALMTGLDRHFGSDASLDTNTAASLARFLEQNAGRERRGSATPVLRITETRWFAHEHDEVPDRAWNHPQVKGRANCAACHLDAARGDYNERRIRLPR